MSQYFDTSSPEVAAILDDVLDGLTQPEKAISPKYFYDESGSKLFDRICELPEYYQTRTESQILRENIAAIVDRIGPDSQLIEYGSGSSLKTRILLSHLPSLAAYVPIDICREHLEMAADALRTEFPKLKVEPICADYMSEFALPSSVRWRASRRVFFFPGSTIGNLEPDEAKCLLEKTRRLAGPRGALLIGVDLKKDKAVLHHAYNDASGVTAAFNLNLLRRFNRECRSDFDLDSFCHAAFYNEHRGRIEMHLVSKRPQTVSVDGRQILFREGETIHTENSYKYHIDEFQELARSVGYESCEVWTDPRRWFSVHYLQ
jgi:dimethylhistidine N-methyltransferase